MPPPAVNNIEASPPAARTEQSRADETKPIDYFAADLVVTRDAKGQPCSRYGDALWDLRAYSTDQSTGRNLSFFDCAPFAASSQDALDLGARIRAQQKALVWLHMDAGRLRAQGTLLSANQALTAWCRAAHGRGVTLFQLLTDPAGVAHEVGALCLGYARHSIALIDTLWRHRADLGLAADLRRTDIKRVIAADLARRGPQENQTPLIPSRIYSAILWRLVDSLNVIERELEDVLSAYCLSMAASRAVPCGANLDQRKAWRAKALPEVVESMKRLGYAPTSGKALNRFIATRLNHYQAELMLIVIAFTGMRIGEACILPLHHGLESFDDRGARHFLIHGFTHKLRRGVKSAASWVTNREGYRAVSLAQRIATAVLQEWTLTGPEDRSDAENKALLFPCTMHPYRRRNSRTLWAHQVRVVASICPTVTQEDVDELNRLELERRWQRQGIEVGKPWPLRFHQLRRSLSVYAHRSGMVSLPALKAQLQHITEEMSAYYADGYSRAVNLVSDPGHFSHEWNAARAESNFAGYALSLLLSDMQQAGPAAERMARTIASRSRAETLQLFREGKLAYRDTVLGGCVSTAPCQVSPLNPIPFDCLESNCVNLVVQRQRLDLVIGSQESVVASLDRSDPGSVEHRLEVTHLQLLLSARQRFKEQT